MATNLKITSKTGADNFNLQDFIDDFNTVKTTLDGLIAGTLVVDKGIIKAKLEQSVQDSLDSVVNKSNINNPSFTGIVTTAGQIKFPATQNPSADVNTLDDYEEGVWTPTLTFGGNSVGVVYSIRNGYYTKIGNMVFFNCIMNITNKGTSTGVAYVSGLPFAVSGTLPYSVCTCKIEGLTSIVGAPHGTLFSSGTTIRLDYFSGGATSLIMDTHFTNTGFVVLSGSYPI